MVCFGGLEFSVLMESIDSSFTLRVVISMPYIRHLFLIQDDEDFILYHLLEVSLFYPLHLDFKSH